MEDKNNKGQEKKRTLSFAINNVRHKWPEQYITGAQIRTLGQIPSDHDVYLDIKEPWKDDLILDDEEVDLARQGVEHFISLPQVITLIVNGKEKQWRDRVISFVQVITLAYGSYQENANYTVNYGRGPNANQEGSMLKGETIFVKNKMIVNATLTNKS